MRNCQKLVIKGERGSLVSTSIVLIPSDRNVLVILISVPLLLTLVGTKL